MKDIIIGKIISCVDDNYWYKNLIGSVVFMADDSLFTDSYNVITFQKGKLKPTEYLVNRADIKIIGNVLTKRKQIRKGEN